MPGELFLITARHVTDEGRLLGLRVHVVLQHNSAQLTSFVLSQSMCYGGMRAQITGQQEDTVPMKMPEL